MSGTMQILLAGVRGTVPVHAPAFSEFGGATSSLYVRAGGETFILDAGSGLRGDSFRQFSDARRFTVLLSHSHADHLLGFPVFAPFFDPSCQADIYLKTRDGRDGRSQIESLMSPPLWPVGTSAMGASLRFHDVPASFRVGQVQIETMEVRHPGGCTSYKLQYGGVSMVYATDFEAVEGEAAFEHFARDCNLLLLDAQYTPSEYTRTRGFGHSTVERSVALAASCRAKQTILIHHDPNRTDCDLAAWDQSLRAACPNVHFGREGEEVLL